MSERWWMKCDTCGVDLEAVPWWKRPWCAVWHHFSVPTCESLERFGDTEHEFDPNDRPDWDDPDFTLGDTPDE